MAAFSAHLARPRAAEGAGPEQLLRPDPDLVGATLGYGFRTGTPPKRERFVPSAVG